ncbi:hypothetical protein SAMN02983003_0693 [Devosia enhydra]|uniref:Uncharacterized protein n=1 Tax=Devosia enhydra TaxID=665118 RepID=A0A1K2HU03_9HYPH|nr:hypothetical protein [Devosia enhydra]SFZ81790.1 hypothetical protein SAMN02983003_0693 [Devosia enhydra]
MVQGLGLTLRLGLTRRQDKPAEPEPQERQAPAAELDEAPADDEEEPAYAAD